MKSPHTKLNRKFLLKANPIKMILQVFMLSHRLESLEIIKQEIIKGRLTPQVKLLDMSLKPLRKREN